MRDILFRGKAVGSDSWEYGFYTRTESSLPNCKVAYKHYIMPNYASAFYGIEVDSSTVSEFTGATDKNGNKIFEGDIIYSDICKSKAVIYDEEAEAFCLYDKSIISPQYLGRYNTEHFEIIGNIYDNPELLEEINGR